MGTVTVRYIADPLRMAGQQVRVVECTGTALDCIRRAFPDLDASALVIVRGVAEIPPDALVSPGEILACAYRPTDPTGITAAAFWKIVITALVSAAISYLVAYLTRPKQRNKTASPAYSVNIEQNAARLGGTIPVIYGRVLALPDVAAQAYAEYVAHNEKVSMLLCLGMGEYEIHDIFIGETRVTDFPAGNVTTFIFPPAAHGQVLGNIERISGVVEDMFTIPETTGVDIAAPNDPPEVTVAASANGGTLIPDTASAATLWQGLVPGRKYVVTNSAGGSATLTYVGIGANNSAVFDGPLPTPGPPGTRSGTATLLPITDAVEGYAMQLKSNTYGLGGLIGQIIYVEAGGLKRGPYQIYAITDNALTTWLRKSGPGFQSINDAQIYPSQSVIVHYNAFVTYSITEWHPDTPTAADPYRWRGWFAACRPGVTVDKIWIDFNAPNGIAWVTDKGDYNNIAIEMRLQIQQIDDDSNPGAMVLDTPIKISGATSNPRRITYGYPMPYPARYRVRLARTNNRDQRASKEITRAEISAIRARIYHPPGTPAYENCTMLAMQFTASAGLSAASNRRIKVDCTRRLINPATSGYVSTSNPALICYDAYTNEDYGGGRPAAEFDWTTYSRLSAQWGTVNGFNGVFDQPTTLIEGLQAILSPVRALPLPIGSTLSVAQDCPRPRAYVFGPETIVAGTTAVGYNFDGADHPDCLEVIYTDPETFADARVYYPSKGINPETSELFGCTSAAHALSWARLRWQEKFYNRKTVQFELEGEGYLLQPLTRFGLAVPALDWGTGGVVVNYDPATMVASLDSPPPQAGNAVLYFKREDGTLGPATLFAALTERTVRLLSDPGVTMKTGDQSGDGTRWVGANVAEQFFEFSVANLEASGPMRVRVSGQQYTAAKYVGTFLEGWSP